MGISQWYINVPMMRTAKPIALRMFTTMFVFSIWYSGWSWPQVRVIAIPNIQIITVLQTSASERETGEIFLETVTAIGTEMAIEMMRPTFRRRRKVLLLMSYQYPLKLYRQSSPSMGTQLLSLQGQCTYWKAKVSGTIAINPQIPSRKTSFKALSSYLLKIHFQKTSPMLLKIMEARSNRIPRTSSPILPEELSLYITATTCTLVIPTKASTHPKIEELLKMRLRKRRERMAVKMMLPPLEICQTELSTILRAVQLNRVDNKSMKVGKRTNRIDAFFFYEPVASSFGALKRSNRQTKPTRVSPRNMRSVCMKGWKNLPFPGMFWIFCSFSSS